MHYFKLLPLSLLMVGLYSNAHAEHISLPTISVEGIAEEETPYVIPPLSVSTPDTGDMVKRLPGANINKNGPLTSVVQYRGLFGDRVNVLIDGVRIDQAGPNRMDSPLSYLPSSRVADVSLYRGIAPVSSGIETIGGTVMANSKKAEFASGDEAELHGNATAAYAENGSTRHAGLLASIATQTHRFQVVGSVDRGDDLEFDGGKILSSKHERDTVGINYAFQKLGHELELDIEHHDTGETGTVALPMDIIYARSDNYKIKFAKALNNGGKISTRLTYQDAEHLMNNYQLRTKMSAMQRFALSDVESFGYHFTYEKDAWSFGLEGDQADHNATVYNPNNATLFLENYKDIERDRASIFAEWDGNLNNDWDLTSGIRFTRISMDAGTVSTNMGGAAAATLATNFNNSDRSQSDNLVDLSAVFTRHLTSDLDIEFGLARKQRAPSYQARYLWATMESTSGLADGNNYVGDVNLKPETAYQAELGLDWHTPKASFSPRVFYHHINDYIQGTTYASSGMMDPATMLNNMMGGGTLLQYSNVDAKLYGMDANWFVALNDTWQLEGTVSYVRGERRDTNDNLYRIAPLTARTMLSYVQTDWRVGIETEAVAAQNKISTENNESKTGGYALFNLTGLYQVSEAIKLSAGINNVFDRQYQNHLGGYNRISDNPDIAQGDRVYGLGRSAYAAVNINW
ncbi:MAG: TonB-dependent receptor [Gammaproteobacteria bacterium]|nr:MAG: TonB-dependent receptor [Gammaproteobacteria bacterium]